MSCPQCCSADRLKCGRAHAPLTKLGDGAVGAVDGARDVEDDSTRCVEQQQALRLHLNLINLLLLFRLLLLSLLLLLEQQAPGVLIGGGSGLWDGQRGGLGHTGSGVCSAPAAVIGCLT